MAKYDKCDIMNLSSQEFQKAVIDRKTAAKLLSTGSQSKGRDDCTTKAQPTKPSGHLLMIQVYVHAFMCI